MHISSCGTLQLPMEGALGKALSKQWWPTVKSILSTVISKALHMNVFVLSVNCLEPVFRTLHWNGIAVKMQSGHWVTTLANLLQVPAWLACSSKYSAPYSVNYTGVELRVDCRQQYCTRHWTFWRLDLHVLTEWSFVDRHNIFPFFFSAIKHITELPQWSA